MIPFRPCSPRTNPLSPTALYPVTISSSTSHTTYITSHPIRTTSHAKRERQSRLRDAPESLLRKRPWIPCVHMPWPRWLRPGMGKLG